MSLNNETHLYIFKICCEDGSTPLGQCPRVEVEATDYLDAYAKVLKANKGYEVVSWGLKSDIEAYNKKYGTTL